MPGTGRRGSHWIRWHAARQQSPLNLSEGDPYLSSSSISTSLRTCKICIRGVEQLCTLEENVTDQPALARCYQCSKCRPSRAESRPQIITTDRLRGAGVGCDGHRRVQLHTRAFHPNQLELSHAQGSRAVHGTSAKKPHRGKCTIAAPTGRACGQSND